MLLLFGLALSVAVLMVGGSLVASLVNRFWWLTYLGSAVIAWTGIGLVLEDEALGNVLGGPDLGRAAHYGPGRGRCAGRTGRLGHPVPTRPIGRAVVFSDTVSGDRVASRRSLSLGQPDGGVDAGDCLERRQAQLALGRARPGRRQELREPGEPCSVGSGERGPSRFPPVMMQSRRGARSGART